MGGTGRRPAEIEIGVGGMENRYSEQAKLE